MLQLDLVSVLQDGQTMLTSLVSFVVVGSLVVNCCAISSAPNLSSQLLAAVLQALPGKLSHYMYNDHHKTLPHLPWNYMCLLFIGFKPSNNKFILLFLACYVDKDHMRACWDLIYRGSHLTNAFQECSAY